jgi:acetolactate synthase I/II/III large subunit
MQELAIVKQHNLNVKTIILNNKFLGMVKQWQDLFFDKRYASTSIPVQPDFVKLAECYGLKGYRADTAKDVTSVIEQALSTKGGCIVDILVDPEEHVYPMVPAGGANKDMVLSKEQDRERVMAEVKAKGAKK